MSSAIEFLNETFTDLEVKSFIDENKDCWFQLSHICKVLGYSNTTDAMNYHTDEDERQLLEPVSGMKVWFISEEGLYGLILGSKKKEAKVFKKWVKGVLKKLRNQGYYIAQNDDATLAAMTAEIEELKQKRKAFYSPIGGFNIDEFWLIMQSHGLVHDKSAKCSSKIYRKMKEIILNIDACQPELVVCQRGRIRDLRNFEKCLIFPTDVWIDIAKKSGLKNNASIEFFKIFE
jgi:prophage antirepressor-like protein